METDRIRNGQDVLREEAGIPGSTSTWCMVQATINGGQEQDKMRKKDERMGGDRL